MLKSTLRFSFAVLNLHAEIPCPEFLSSPDFLTLKFGGDHFGYATFACKKRLCQKNLLPTYIKKRRKLGILKP